jgi:hypothetical protein
MLRKILISIVILLIMGCSKSMVPTASLLSGSQVQFESDEIEYVGRLGVTVENIQFGLASHYLDNSEIDQQYYGVYIIQDVISEPNLPVIGNWYVGAQATLDLDNDGGMYGPIVGFRNTLGSLEILTEYQPRHYNKALALLEDTPNEDLIYMGMTFYFPDD